MTPHILNSIILTYLEPLDNYKALVESGRQKEVTKIASYVNKSIGGLPWFFYLPVKMMMSLTALLCFMMTFHPFSSLNSHQRQKFLHKMRLVPFYLTFSNLIRSLSYIVLLDISSDKISLKKQK